MSATPPGSCLMSNSPGGALRQLPAHALAHASALRRAGCRGARDAAARRGARRSNSARSFRRTGDRARMQQRLVLPRPGLLALIFGERVDAGDEHAALAARAQAHVHLVEPAGARVHREQMHDALREAHEEHLVVDRLRGVGFLPLAVRIVQEHEIEIGGVAELHAAELAVARCRRCAPAARSRALAAHRHAELRGRSAASRAPSRARRSARRRR